MAEQTQLKLLQNYFHKMKKDILIKNKITEEIRILKQDKQILIDELTSISDKVAQLSSELNKTRSEKKVLEEEIDSENQKLSNIKRISIERLR